jgi:hypothetical protein
MSTIKANNYEASTAGNNLIFKTNNAERMRIDTSGNLTLSSGNLTLSSGSLTGTVQRGSHGSLSIDGSTNNYSGVDFTAANATFMIRTTDRLSGVYKDNNTWAYYIDGSGNYYSGGGLCPQTTVPPTAAAHLTRKDYVDFGSEYVITYDDTPNGYGNPAAAGWAGSTVTASSAGSLIASNVTTIDAATLIPAKVYTYIHRTISSPSANWPPFTKWIINSGGELCVAWSSLFTTANTTAFTGSIAGSGASTQHTILYKDGYGFTTVSHNSSTYGYSVLHIIRIK